MAMTGKVDYKDAEVDNDHSPVLERCRPWWVGGTECGTWQRNWEVELRFSRFAPVSVLAKYYYIQLLRNYFTYVDVNGERYDKIRGLYLLGPVCHAVADACVPQHAIPAMGYKHQEWENLVETWAGGYELEDFNQVRSLLDNHMRRVIYTDGEFKNTLAIDFLVYSLCGLKTLQKLFELNNTSLDRMKQGPSDNVLTNFLNNMKNFWNQYITTTNLNKVKADAKFSYNLALAATVRVITEAYYDVLRGGVPLKGVSSYKLSGRVAERRSIDIHRIAALRYVSARSLLGFKPMGQTVEKYLLKTKENLTRWNKRQMSDKEIALGLAELEKELFNEFKKAKAGGLKNFEHPDTLEFPQQIAELRQAFGLPDVSKNIEIHSLFGLATFRPPTQNECKDGQKFEEYLKESEANALNGKLIAVTRCIALHKFLQEETSSGVRRRKIAQVIQKLEKLREFIVRSKKTPFDRELKREPRGVTPVDSISDRSPDNIEEVDED